MIGMVLSGLLAVALSGVFGAEAEELAPEGTYRSFPVNEFGLTYGSSGRASGPDGEPDLIRVLATNGSVGYSYKNDLEGEIPASPEEASRWHITHPYPRLIPVYEVDGVTVIGEFEIDSGGRFPPTPVK